MYLEVSLECLDISEKSLDKSTLADSVLTDDTNSVSLGEDRSACIEEWLLASDEGILYLDKCLRPVLVIWE